MRAREGFVLVLLVVIVAVVLIASAALAPSLFRDMNRVRIDKAVSELESIWGAVVDYDWDVKRLPGSLQHMSRAITTSDQDVCGNYYPSGIVGHWDGPYWTRNPTSAGLKIRIGTLLDAPERVPLNGAGELHLIVTGVSLEDAVAVNRVMDPAEGEAGQVGDATGIIRWSAPDAEGLVTLRHAQPVTGGCGGPDQPGTTDSGGSTGTDTTTTSTDTTTTSTDTTSTGTSGGITLAATTSVSQNTGYVDLTWSGASGTNVDVYRNGARVTTTANDGAHTDSVGKKPSGTYTYQVCEFGTNTCSPQVSVTF